MSNNDKKTYVFTAISIIILVIVSVGIYLKALSNGFVYDDFLLLVENRWNKDLRFIPEILTSSDWSFQEGSEPSNLFRPTLHLSYLFINQIFGLTPWAFHLQNIIFHALNTVMVFLIASVLLIENGSRVVREKPHVLYLPPLTAAILFSTHPINTEVVAWISAVSELHFSFFCLLSFYFYIRKNGTLSIPSVVFFFLGALSKETTAVLPAIFIAYDLFVKKERLLPAAPWIKRYSPYAAAGMVYLAIRFIAIGGLAPEEIKYPLGTLGYTFNLFPLIAQYLKKLLLPMNLNVLYTFRPIEDLLTPVVIISFITAAVLFFLVFKLQKNYGELSFLLLWIILPLLPALLSFTSREFPFAERYLYMPTMGFAVLAAYVFQKLIRKSLALPIIIFALITALYSFGTIGRIPVWESNLTLWTDAAEKAPDNFYPLYSLGVEYMERGRYEKAEAKYLTSLELKPDFHNTHYNLGVVYYGMGLFEKSIASYEKALEFAKRPLDLSLTRTNLGNAYASAGLLDEAINQYKKALEIEPSNRLARRNMEMVQRRLMQ